jgi:uncharacterized membrane protein
VALLLLVVGYPIVCHIGALAGHPQLGIAWLGLLLLIPELVRRGGARSYLRIGAGAGTILAALTLGAEHNDLLLRIPPITVTLGLALLFGESLRPGRVALIVRIAAHFRGTLPASVRDYSERLTLIWTCIFVALAVESALLAAFADPFWWSVVTNFVNYVLIIGFFVVEYVVRRRILRDVPHEPFLEYVGSLMRFGLRG